jgi:hypothetical protein
MPSAGATGLALHGVHYRGNKLLIDVGAASVSVDVLERAPDAAAVDLCGVPGRAAIPLGDRGARGPVSFARGQAASVRPAGTCDE